MAAPSSSSDGAAPGLRRPEELLEALDPEQRAVAEALEGPVCVLAGAGTGKTRAITTRIAHGALTGALPPQHVLAVTFTTRAAGEMRARLRALGVPAVQARTFHSAALRQVGHFLPRVTGAPPPRVLDSKIPLVARAASRSRLPTDRASVRDLASEVEWAKATLVTPSGYAAAVARAGRTPPREVEQVAAVFAGYEDLKHEEGALDFDDILMACCHLLENEPGVAQQVRDQYRHFVVDEFQDVTPLQERLLDAWLGSRDDVCVVGDPAQTIYSFAGASTGSLLRFPQRFPDARVVRLVRDYRSTPQVVAAANAVLAGATAQTVRLEAQRPDGPAPVVLEQDDEEAEARWVASRCAALLADGVPPSEIAVLFRTNGQSPAFETALASQGVPYLVRGGERFFERREVREAVLLVRGAARSAEADAPEGLVPAVRDVLGAAGFDPERAPDGGAARERWESLAALLRLAEDLAAADPRADLRAFAAELEERAASSHPPTVEGVTLASLHAAKGLEWDAVFLVGLSEGYLPIVHASTPEQLEEERRLLYVGVTRAREHLALTWSLSRAPGGRRSRRPSRFLDGLRPPGTGEGSTAGARRSRRGGGLDRAALPEDVDPALVDRLRAWRSEQAKELKQPAFCVFTDATLVALAAARPEDRAAMARVPGVGSAKLDKFGDDVLALVAGVDVSER